MKKTTLAVLTILAVAFVAAPALRAGNGNDFQAIQKAVKQNPSYEKGREVTLFKVLVTDARTGRETVRITLPISMVEALFNCVDGKQMHFHDEGCHVDLKALFADLKKAGPMSLIEIKDEDALIKVWLE